MRNKAHDVYDTGLNKFTCSTSCDKCKKKLQIFFLLFCSTPFFIRPQCQTVNYVLANNYSV